MNIFRSWGSLGIHKDCFYEECNKNGIMVCNNALDKYFGTDNSLEKRIQHSNWLQCAGYKTMKLILSSAAGYSSEYSLLFKNVKKPIHTKTLKFQPTSSKEAFLSPF